MSKTTNPARRAQPDQNPILILRDRFVFNTRTGAFFTTSPEGAFILRAAWNGVNRAAIEAAVVKAFAVPPSVAMGDTERFLLRLGEMGLLPDPAETAR